ncbi:hypothetical protein [Streptomyces sp. NPDC002889]|uniref:hypothetical protein n=1 Tax=Streptomyces sp. NPDC002889 TaxID=3364669 RepID=UPI00369A788C
MEPLKPDDPQELGTYRLPPAGAAVGQRPGDPVRDPDRPGTECWQAAGEELPPPPPQAQTRWNSFMWALLIPGLLTLAGVTAQYPYGMFVGVVLGLGTVTAAAVVLGGRWHRPGAAVVACVCGFALTFFAGPGGYELYMKQLGEPVPAMVATIEEKDGLLQCRVVEIESRTVHDVSQQQNCFSHIRMLQRVTLRKDPLGLLEPRLPDGPDQAGTTRLTLMIAAGLFAATGAAVLYAGLRRRAAVVPRRGPGGARPGREPVA